MRGNCLDLPHFRQEADYTCVPACVRMILAYYGRDIPEAEIAAVLVTEETGTRFADIVRIARLGFEIDIATGAVAALTAMVDRHVPCIARVKTVHLPRYPLPRWVPHTVVVVGVDGGRVYFHAI